MRFFNYWGFFEKSPKLFTGLLSLAYLICFFRYLHQFTWHSPPVFHSLSLDLSSLPTAPTSFVFTPYKGCVHLPSCFRIDPFQNFTINLLIKFLCLSKESHLCLFISHLCSTCGFLFTLSLIYLMLTHSGYNIMI